MEPPSPIGSNRDNITGPHSDDPLSRSLSPEAFLIVTRTPDEDSPEGGYIVCSYNARTGLYYIGTTGTTGS